MVRVFGWLVLLLPRSWRSMISCSTVTCTISHVRADPRAARRPGHRLVPALAATVLAVSPVTLRSAVLHAQRLPNVEGYPVLGS
jgi:hypothetical protein